MASASGSLPASPIDERSRAGSRVWTAIRSGESSSHPSTPITPSRARLPLNIHDSPCTSNRNEEHETASIALNDLGESSVIKRTPYAEPNSLETSARPPLRRLPTTASQATSKRLPVIRRFWRRHIAVSVRLQDARDHLALERTYLAYLRTSLVFANTGVFIAQLLKLRNTVQYELTDRIVTFVEPLAGLLIISAMLVAILGAIRFWRQQEAMVRGKIHAGGFETIICGFLFISVSITLLATVMIAESGQNY